VLIDGDLATIVLALVPRCYSGFSEVGSGSAIPLMCQCGQDFTPLHQRVGGPADTIDLNLLHTAGA